MFGPKKGIYWTICKSDKRFEKSWRRSGLVCMGTPEWLVEWANNKAKKLGLKKYPSDLEINFMKD